MNVSPDELKSSVGEQVVDGGYGSTSEYVRDIDRALDYYLSKADTALPRPE
jgi:Arc/MetJ-type ribon-helix-helix transcriptional regulator